MNAQHLHNAAAQVHGAHIPQGLLGAVFALIVFFVVRAVVLAFLRGIGGRSR